MSRDYSRSRDFSRSDSRSSSRSFSSSRGGGGGRGGFGGRQTADDSQNKPVEELMICEFDQLLNITNLPYVAADTFNLNSYGITLSKTMKVTYQYDLEYVAETNKGKLVDLTSFKKREKQEVHSAMRVLFTHIIKSNDDFFDANPITKNVIVYDNAKLLFSQKKMLEKKDKKVITVECHDIPTKVQDIFGTNIKKIDLTVRLTNELDFTKISSNVTDLEVNRSFTQYLELLFSQHQISCEKFAAFGKKYFDKESKFELDRSPFILKSGSERSIKLINSYSGFITMLPKLKLMYPDGNLHDIVRHIADRDGIWRRKEQLTKILKKVAVTSIHLKRNRVFYLFGLSDKSASNTYFMYNDKQISVLDYYRDVKNIRLKYADDPLAIEKKGKDDSYFPLELLNILPNQAVPKSRMNSDLDGKVIRKSQKAPADFVESIENERALANIQNADPLIKASGVRVNVGRHSTVNGELLYPPNIRYKNVEKVLRSGIWGMMKDDEFIEGAVIKRLMFVLADRRLDVRPAEEFCRSLMDRARHYGMRIENHEFDSWDNPSRDIRRLEDYVKHGIDYVFIIGDGDELHHEMKHAEIRTKLITQHIRSFTVKKANNTLFDNLVFKMNLKANGKNYELCTAPTLAAKMNNVTIIGALINKTMFFGVDISHPGPQSEFQRVTGEILREVTAVGFASNTKAGSSNCSKGVCGYQKIRQQLVSKELLEKSFEEAIKEYYRNSGIYPRWIVVYRSGVSEAELSKIEDEEVPVYRQVIEDLKVRSPEFKNCQLTIFVVNRRTIHRIVPREINRNDKPPQQNCKSGSCVTSGFGGKPDKSFLLVSQRALIGTANPPMYTIVYDDSGLSMDSLRVLTYSLCFAHGIVTSPTAVPAPLVSAADLSKRARNNFKTGRYQLEEIVQAGGDIVYRQRAGDELNEDEKMEVERNEKDVFNKINEILKITMENVRFWA